jgi:hypothetical protein
VRSTRHNHEERNTAGSSFLFGQIVSLGLRFLGNRRALEAFLSKTNGDGYGPETKHEVVVLALGTLAAVPVVTGIGLAIVAGVLAW